MFFSPAACNLSLFLSLSFSLSVSFPESLPPQPPAPPYVCGFSLGLNQSFSPSHCFFLRWPDAGCCSSLFFLNHFLSGIFECVLDDKQISWYSYWCACLKCPDWFGIMWVFHFCDFVCLLWSVSSWTAQMPHLAHASWRRPQSHLSPPLAPPSPPLTPRTI